MPDDTLASQSLFSRIEEAMTIDGVPLAPATAWNFLYRWNLGYREGIPHIAETNVVARGRWKARANAVSEWLAGNLAPGRQFTREELGERLGLGHREAVGNRENQTGRGLEDALAVLLDRFSGVRPLVRASVRTLRGYEIVPKGEIEQLDLVLLSREDFRLFISCFWTSRRDRVPADLYEAVFVRRRRPDVQVAVVTNEFQPSILNSLINSPEIDRVYHVCLPALLVAHTPQLAEDSVTVEEILRIGRQGKEVQTFMHLRTHLKDIEDLFTDVRAIAGLAEPPADPSEEFDS